MDFVTFDTIFDITGKDDILDTHHKKKHHTICKQKEVIPHKREIGSLWGNVIGLGICCILALMFAWFITKYEESKGA